ncbi:hypothetical protein LUZ60_015335 [Juncus effusus]|nr:hypothetical protein LUZ60_015335 [Juncus effusus]
MYRSGVRTPNAAQIQQITAHLAFYGKIEGKNVFYWFQNHKARERQKLRRRLCRHHQLLLLNNHQNEQVSPPPPSPTEISPSFSHVHPHSTVPSIFPQGYNMHEAPTTPGLNLVGKLDSNEDPMAGNTSSDEWTAMPPCCRPLKTLDLFPTKSTGLRDECSSSKSSSCSTSTN